MTPTPTRFDIRARGSLLALIAALLIGMLAVATPATAFAAPQPEGPFTLEITKLEQPETLGDPATGLPIVDAATKSPPVAGATFAAWRVPGIDLTSNEGQQEAAALTAEQASSLVDTSSTPAARDTTRETGDATLSGLAQGLYYVVETAVPDGYVGSAPFLVALPLTNPDTHDSWLSTVHVYPKNARVGITLDVNDAKAVRIGDTVEWTSRSDIPRSSTIDGYRVVQEIDPALRVLTGNNEGDSRGPAVSIDAAGAPRLTPGTDYTLTVKPASSDSHGPRITVDFLPAGLAKLAKYPGSKVVIDYRTEVLRSGELSNTAVLYPSKAAIAGDDGVGAPPTATAETKWGPIAVRTFERGNPKHLIPGATFKLYLSAADARNGTNAVTVAGVNTWTSDNAGMVTIDGLRFSNFANGLDRAPGDPLYRYYYLMPTSFPTGWTGEKTPLRGSVISAEEPQVLELELWRPGSSNGGGSDHGNGGLANTGAQITGLVLLGVALLGGGALLVLRRRREREAPSSVEPTEQ